MPRSAARKPTTPRLTAAKPSQDSKEAAKTKPQVTRTPESPAQRRAPQQQHGLEKSPKVEKTLLQSTDDKPAKPAKPEKLAKPAKPAKEKLVRDGFTMPESEFRSIAAIKQRAMGFQREVKKSEVLRAGLKALDVLSDAQLKDLLESLPTIKTGRPKKGH